MDKSQVERKKLKIGALPFGGQECWLARLIDEQVLPYQNREARMSRSQQPLVASSGRSIGEVRAVAVSLISSQRRRYYAAA